MKILACLILLWNFNCVVWTNQYFFLIPTLKCTATESPDKMKPTRKDFRNQKRWKTIFCAIFSQPASIWASAKLLSLSIDNLAGHNVFFRLLQRPFLMFLTMNNGRSVLLLSYSVRLNKSLVMCFLSWEAHVYKHCFFVSPCLILFCIICGICKWQNK